MSIRSFLESAEILYEKGKYDEALCLVCIAIDARSAELYPKIKSCTKRYKLFLKDNFWTICKRGFPGILAQKICIKLEIPCESLEPDKDGYVDMEQIIYHVLRCGLVHKCKIDETIQFTDKTIIGNWNNVFCIPKSIIWGLIDSLDETC